MPPLQQQRHYLINNHIIKQSDNLKFNAPAPTMIRPPTITAATSPLQIICSNSHHQHDQWNRRKTPLLQLHHHFAASLSYGRATTFDFQHDVPPSDADDVISFHHP